MKFEDLFSNNGSIEQKSEIALENISDWSMNICMFDSLRCTLCNLFCFVFSSNANDEAGANENDSSDDDVYKTTRYVGVCIPTDLSRFIEVCRSRCI